MANFQGNPVTIGRFFGFADYTDPASLPLGLSPNVRNTDFSLTAARTRDGVVTTMQGKNASPVTGLLSASYTPEDATESFFRLHAILDAAGSLQVESPAASGAMLSVADWASVALVNPPAGAHMFGVPAYNNGWVSFAKLVKLSVNRYGFVPAATPAVLELNTRRFDPYGLRPYGDTWLAGETYVVGEIVTPTVAGGNGHTYRCMQSGVSAAAEPAWPIGDSQTVNDNTVIWKEWTAVLANRIPVPDAPVVAVGGGGTWDGATDVYIITTALNPQGETTASPATKVTPGAGGSAQVTLPGPLPAWLTELPGNYAVTGYNVYAASVTTGQPAPPQSDYALVGEGAVGTVYGVGGPGAGTVPPSRNSARITPGMLPTPDEEPVIQRLAAAGAFAAGRDVYVRKTLLNGNGETPLGPSNSIINTLVNDAVQVTVETQDGYQVTSIGIYEADVATGELEPDKSAFALVGYYAAGDTATITTTAAGNPAPTENTTGSSGNITKDDPTAGINGTQGMRYAALAFEDFTGTVSGIRQAAVISTVVDEDGWELGIYHYPTGPANVKRRIIAPSVANGTNAGAFWKIDPTAVSDGVTMTATVIEDNVSSSLVMDFTDAYLIGQTDITYRLQTIKPYACVDLYYAPSVDRFFQSGVAGFSGHWVSRAADAASYQGDVGYISVGADGERAFCVREFRETVYSLRERSAFTLTPQTADPSSWTASRRWSKVGPCGPRAVDVGKQVMPFVHRSGLHIYDGSGDPRNVSDELPDDAGLFWRRINWAYAETIWLSLDEERKVVRIGLPLDDATSPSIELAVWFVSGWDRPTGQDSDTARKISINDISANLGMRIERDLDTQEGDASFRTSQFVYASAGPNGTVQAIQPGRRDDNGSGIDWVYETASADELLHLCKVQGYVFYGEGEGNISVELIAGKNMANPNGDNKPGTVLRLRDLVLTPNTPSVARYAPSKVSEQWRMRFTNRKVAGAWCGLKQLEIYITDVFKSR